MTDSIDPQTAEPGLCPNCQHPEHGIGIECEHGVEHDGQRRWHVCLCLNRPGASRPCSPLMTCQGGRLGYADVWYLQRGQRLQGADGGVIKPDALLAAEEAASAPSAPADRATLSAKLWAVAEHHIVAEWICCEPLESGHRLCAKGYAALGMAKSLLVDADPEKAWNPEAPLLNAVLALLTGRMADEERQPGGAAFSPGEGVHGRDPYYASSDTEAQQQAETQATDEPPVCEGFRWIGQSFATCDRCGQPAWEHAGEEVAVEGAGPFDNERTVRPWKPGEADAIRAKWASPAVVAEPGKESDDPRTVCVCGHTRGEHVTVGGPFGRGRLLCDECDGLSPEACKEFEAL